MPNRGDYLGRPMIHATRATVPIPLDGNLENWRKAVPVTFSGRPHAGHPRHATVYAMWDAAHLYFAFDVYSSRLQARVREHHGDKLWWDDGVEFLIDAQRHGTKEYLPDDFCYHINILNAVYEDRGTASGEPDCTWTGSARHAVKIFDDYHYLVEVAVPWEEIGFDAVVGQTSIGTDFCVNGTDPETGKYSYFDWCHLSAFHDPSGFGELVLQDPSSS